MYLPVREEGMQSAVGVGVRVCVGPRIWRMNLLVKASPVGKLLARPTLSTFLPAYLPS